MDKDSEISFHRLAIAILFVILIFSQIEQPERISIKNCALLTLKTTGN